MFWPTARMQGRLARKLTELEADYVKALEENVVAWREVSLMGRVIARYDAKAKVRVDSDTRLREAEETARVMTHRMTAVDVFWTGLLNGEYDEGYIPAPTEPLAEWEQDALEVSEEYDPQDGKSLAELERECE